MQSMKTTRTPAARFSRASRLPRSAMDRLLEMAEKKEISARKAVDYLADRFADQRWLVYDTRRHYGYLYDLQEVREISMEDDAHLLSGRLSDEILAADERLFQQTWRDYLGALTIKERLNLRLQRQHMPRRFWKYLTEKQ